MITSIKQGIINAQKNPLAYLAAGSSRYISHVISPTETLVTFSHGDDNYLQKFVETKINAWGPLPLSVSNDTNAHLYWDINLLNGNVTYGFTLVDPVVSSTQPTAIVDQHWFDLTTNLMKVYNGVHWKVVVRVFAGISVNASNTVFTHKALGSQVGLTGNYKAGFILKDMLNVPIVTSSGHFLTTDTPVFVNSVIDSTGSTGVLIQPGLKLIQVRAAETIPAFSLVYFSASDTISLATRALEERFPVGLITSTLYTNDLGFVILDGEISTDTWDWSGHIGSTLYAGLDGQIATIKPDDLVYCVVGIVKNENTIILSLDSRTTPVEGGGGGGGEPITVSDQGNQLVVGVTEFNFVGAAITASAIGTIVSVNVPGLNVLWDGDTYPNIVSMQFSGGLQFSNPTSTSVEVTIPYGFMVNTTTPNSMVPVAYFNASTLTAQANSDIALVPKGEGALLASVPDNGVGGNKRGACAIDFQRIRNTEISVAAGAHSIIFNGYDNRIETDQTHCSIFNAQNSFITGTGFGNTVVCGDSHQISNSYDTIILTGSVNQIVNTRNIVIAGNDNYCATSNDMQAIKNITIFGSSNSAFTKNTFICGNQNYLPDSYDLNDDPASGNNLTVFGHFNQFTNESYTTGVERTKNENNFVVGGYNYIRADNAVVFGFDGDIRSNNSFTWKPGKIIETTTYGVTPTLITRAESYRVSQMQTAFNTGITPVLLTAAPELSYRAYLPLQGWIWLEGISTMTMEAIVTAKGWDDVLAAETSATPIGLVKVWKVTAVLDKSATTIRLVSPVIEVIAADPETANWNLSLSVLFTDNDNDDDYHTIGISFHQSDYVDLVSSEVIVVADVTANVVKLNNSYSNIAGGKYGGV